jgi:hypothetical protein
MRVDCPIFSADPAPFSNGQNSTHAQQSSVQNCSLSRFQHAAPSGLFEPPVDALKSDPGPKAEMAPHKRHDRSSLKSRHRPATPKCQLRAVRYILHCKMRRIIGSLGRRWHRGPYPHPIAKVSLGSAINYRGGSSIMDIDRDHIDDAILALLYFLGVTTACALGNPSTGPRWSGSIQRDSSRTQSVKLNLSYSLKKVYVNPKRYSESCSQLDAKLKARYS